MNLFKTKLLSSILALMVLYISSCGTILYPERTGQRKGKIDVAVAALDAVGLLFFLIPGIIAFVVDYNNGTIYLPPGKKGIGSIKPAYDLDKMIAIKTGNKHLTNSDIELTVKKHTGKSIDLSNPDVIVKRFDDKTKGKEISVAMGGGIKD
jgi:hypothetical protein